MCDPISITMGTLTLAGMGLDYYQGQQMRKDRKDAAKDYNHLKAPDAPEPAAPIDNKTDKLKAAELGSDADADEKEKKRKKLAKNRLRIAPTTNTLSGGPKAGLNIGG